MKTKSVGAERGAFFPVACVGASIARPCPLALQDNCPGKCVAAVSWRATNGRPYKSFRQSGPEIFLPAARFSPPPPAGGVPSQRGPRGAFLPIVRASGFISACALSKTAIYGILFFYKSTGKPGANRRRKAIGAHRVSQLPTRNCCFTAAGSFASFLGQELTRLKTHRYTGGTKQGIYDALLFSVARGYYLIRSDSAFRHGSAMP